MSAETLTPIAIIDCKDPKVRDEASLDFAGDAANTLGQEVYIADGKTGEIVGTAFPSKKPHQKAYAFGGNGTAFQRIFGHEGKFDPSRGDPIKAG